MGVEMKQMLEQHYDISVEAKKIRSLTFIQLDALVSGKSQSSDTPFATSETSKFAAPDAYVVRYQLKHFAPAEQLVKMNNINDSNAMPIFMVSPVDGYVLMLEQVASRLAAPVYGLQCTQQTPLISIPHMAEEYVRVWLFLCV